MGGCYIRYSENGPGRAAASPSPLLAVPNVTAHYNCLCTLKRIRGAFCDNALYKLTFTFTFTKALKRVLYVTHTHTHTHTQQLVACCQETTHKSSLSKSYVCWHRLFHSRLKTHLFNKPFPPQTFLPIPDCLHDNGTGPDRTYHAHHLIFSFTF